ncbi:MAG TPA: hypothetical protein VKT80_12840 [Chloroflexota bacterium]|nr:hypothetical protein [Chloroflexota bacterium]
MRAALDQQSDRSPDWNGRGQASVFLAALILPLIVGASLFFYNAPMAAPAVSAAGINVSAIAKATVSSRVATPRPMAVPATPVPLLASVEVQPSPTASAVATPTVAQPTATAMPTRPTSALVGLVANTGGDGVFLRHTPVLSDHWIAWPDNTVFVLLGNEIDGDGEHWLQVRDPRNNVGWVPAEYINR